MNTKPKITIGHQHDGNCLAMNGSGSVVCCETTVPLLGFFNNLPPAAHRQISELMEMKPEARILDFEARVGKAMAREKQPRSETTG